MDNELEIISANNLPAIIEVNEDDRKIEEDAETARTNLHDLASKGAIALDELMGIATASQHPRAFEVLANMISTLASVNKDIVGLHKTVNEVKGTKPGESLNIQGGTNIQNAVFVGSTAELARIIRKEKNESKLPE
jgi:hypothetical protein